MKTLYSQFEEPELELACRTWMQPDREEFGGEAGPDREPVLPRGYVHIRSAVQALMSGSPRSGRIPNKTTVHCTGRLTSETAGSLRATIEPLFSDRNTVVLDLTHVTAMDSAGLGNIVSLGASAKAANCRLKLANLNRRLKELLNIARLNELLVDPAFWRTW
ncbi:MAG TPA: STAS domain-containing protein [Terriglobales bacterium]|jgi:anti-anti-sigma factor|nr:STAS domain-containing protein [Terriglobales bacterium]